MRGGQAGLQQAASTSCVGDDLVKLNLYISDMGYQPGRDECVKELVLASLNVDLHEFDEIQAELLPGLANGSNRQRLRLSSCASLEDRRAVTLPVEPFGARARSEAERVNGDSRDVMEPIVYLLGERGPRFENYD